MRHCVEMFDGTRAGLERERVSKELVPSINAAPCSAMPLRTRGTAFASILLITAVASNKAFDEVRRFLVSVVSRSAARSPTLAIALAVIPRKVGTRTLALIRCLGKTSIALICASSSSIARTGIPPLYIPTRRSKLLRLPKMGRTAGSPFAPRNCTLSYHAASTFLAGCCPARRLGQNFSAFKIRATSPLPKPVVIATRELLLRPDSLVMRADAIRTARSRTNRLNSCTVIPASNVRSIRGSITRSSVVMVAALRGSRDRDSLGICIPANSFKYVCAKHYAQKHITMALTRCNRVESTSNWRTGRIGRL